jgi:TonB-dependent SusC/RagA subfamily outer membrane receptor
MVLHRHRPFDAAINGKIPVLISMQRPARQGGGVSVKLRGVTSIFRKYTTTLCGGWRVYGQQATPAGLNAVTSASSGGNSSNQDNPSNRIADLRAEDIANIEILKGASAAAIYGSKAAAGVIIITTKEERVVKQMSRSQDIGFVKVRKLLGTRPLTEDIVQGPGQAYGWDINEYKAAVLPVKFMIMKKKCMVKPASRGILF